MLDALQSPERYASHPRRLVLMTIVNGLLALLLCLSMSSAIAEAPKIINLYLEGPLWALGFNDAKWLVPPSSGQNSPTFAFFSFSSEKAAAPGKPVEQREDAAGRTTRSLPLYLAERLNVETNCKGENHIFVVEHAGPVVSGKEWDPETLLGAFKSSPPDYLVTGHLVQDYLNVRSTMTLKIWDARTRKELVKLTESRLFSEPVNVAAELASAFFKNVQNKGLCTFKPSSAYPAPPDSVLPLYLDALGQLLIQTLAENRMISAGSLWGEEDMINWYLALAKQMPSSAAPKLMYVRGILASIDYGGVAQSKLLPEFIKYLRNSNRAEDVLFQLSPLVHARLKDRATCEKNKAILQNGASGQYVHWLKAIDCKAHR